jgi:tetratricopeptide (TPR) repeat protein
MSLLLEALKKAEKAKEEAQRRAGEGSSELQLTDTAQAQAPAEAAAQPVLTRAELPDITAPLEILPEHLSTAAQPAPAASGLSLESPAPAAKPAGAAPRRATATADSQPAQRATARKVFEAKVREPNPRLPFYIAMGALGAFAVGVVVYFWIQLRPPAPLVNANPVRPQAEAPVTTPAPSVQALAPTASGTATDLPGLPGAAPPAAQPQAPAAPKPKPAAPRPSAQAAAPARPATPAIPRDAPPPRVSVTPRASAPRVAEPAPAPVAAPRPVPRVHPNVAAGYAAYQTGRLDVARTEYQTALREEPGNRDALLGIAALDLREQRYESADAIYRQLLRSDPRDPYAHAGLLALRGQGIDPVTVESRLKTLLAAEPDSGVLNFALGNQFAQQARWAEAQQAYFKAAVAEPENADYAYNLAVSLEHLRQVRPALDYYRRALALSENRKASFDRASVQARVQQLAR